MACTLHDLLWSGGNNVAEQSTTSGAETSEVASEFEDERSSASGEEEVEVPIVEVPPVRPSVRVQRAGFELLDQWNLSELFSHSSSVMRTIPRFLWSSFRIAMKVALEEITTGQQARNDHQQERGWKLFLALPRMLLHRSPRGGKISRDKLISRFDKFTGDQWKDLIEASVVCAEEAATASRRRRRRVDNNDAERRSLRAMKFVQLGELSSGRQALISAPGTSATLAQLRRRQDVPREPVPDLPRGVSTFNLDETHFGRNVRSAKRGAAGGPSGMTCDHLRPLLDSPRDLHTLFMVAESFSRGLLPRSVVQIVKLGWMTALYKKDGRVRGIVAGEVIRRLTARTIAQELGPAVEAATALFQCALSTRAGCECVSHAPQVLCDMDEDATVVHRRDQRLRHYFAACDVARVGEGARRECCVPICAALLCGAVHTPLAG